MTKGLLVSFLALASIAGAKAVPLSTVLKALGAEPGSPANYFSDELQLRYEPTLTTSDDRLRTYFLDAHRYEGKKYINGITTSFAFNQVDVVGSRSGIQLLADTSFMCLQLSKAEINTAWQWIAEKMVAGVTTNGGTYRKTFGKYQAGVDIRFKPSGPLVMASIWRLDKSAGTAQWANYCTIDGYLAY